MSIFHNRKYAAPRLVKRKTANGYAALVRKRKPGKRRRLDDYETPVDATNALTQFCKFNGPILEPAAGSKRMARALAMATGIKVTCEDIKSGHDFLKRTERWPGDIITNPPYRDGLADAFVDKALDLADGRVAMLMELKFLTGTKRAERIFYRTPPVRVVIIPWRINFIAGGKPIKSQFFNHCWIVWPERKSRILNQRHQMNWAGLPSIHFAKKIEFDFK